MDFAKQYGYEFEHEATYDRMCLVNDAVYIAKYATAEDCIAQYGYSPGDNKKKGGKWTATGTQFQIPYVFKKLFSKEEITFDDLCETKSVTSSLYLDMNEDLPDVTLYEKQLDKLEKKWKKERSEKHVVNMETFKTTADPFVAEERDRLMAEIAKGTSTVTLYTTAKDYMQLKKQNTFTLTNKTGVTIDHVIIRTTNATQFGNLQKAIGTQFEFTADAENFTVTIKLNTTGDFTFTNVSTTTAYISGIEIVYEDAKTN
jgi:hypothetical protein